MVRYFLFHIPPVNRCYRVDFIALDGQIATAMPVQWRAEFSNVVLTDPQTNTTGSVIVESADDIKCIIRGICTGLHFWKDIIILTITGGPAPLFELSQGFKVSLNGDSAAINTDTQSFTLKFASDSGWLSF
jgi:hypothetical protein